MAVNSEIAMPPLEGATTQKSGALGQSQAARRIRIVDAAFDIIVEKGDDNVQIREVADRADVALGTVYRYFQSKDRLFAEAYEKWVNLRHDEVVATASDGDTNVERLQCLALNLLEAVEREPQFSRLARQLLATDDRAVVEVMLRSEDKPQILCRAALQGIEQRDVDAIALIVESWIYAARDRLAMGLITLDQAKRLLAKAVRVILEFRDPELEPAFAFAHSATQDGEPELRRAEPKATEQGATA